VKPVFVVTLEGVEPPDPILLTVLAFVPAETADEAEAAGMAALGGRGWTDVRALRAGEITDENAVPPDFANAFASARRHGVGLIIYEP
jgi:hypothetical protein